MPLLQECYFTRGNEMSEDQPSNKLKNLERHIHSLIDDHNQVAFNREADNFLGDIAHIYLELTTRIKAFKEVLEYIKETDSKE